MTVSPAPLRYPTAPGPAGLAWLGLRAPDLGSYHLCIALPLCCCAALTAEAIVAGLQKLPVDVVKRFDFLQSEEYRSAQAALLKLGETPFYGVSDG